MKTAISKLKDHLAHHYNAKLTAKYLIEHSAELENHVTAVLDIIEKEYGQGYLSDIRNELKKRKKQNAGQ